MQAMKKLALLIAAGIGSAILMAPVVGALVRPALTAPSHNINPALLAATAARYRNFSVAQHMAVLREIQSELHPLWRNLSLSQKVKWSAISLARSLLQDTASVAVPAAFVGNQTVVANASGGVVGLLRQGNCSLSLYDGVYSLLPSPSVQLSTPVPNYELTLHDRAGLSTQAGVFANGCADPTLGIGSRRGAYLGKTTQGYAFMAGSGYDRAQSATALLSGAVNVNSTAAQSTYGSDVSFPDIDAIAAGDLNGDGLADIVARDVGSASIKVWLAHGDGTLAAPTAYSLTGASAGTITEAVVLADVNGDGKVDVVVASCSQIGCISTLDQEQIWIFTGKGDGTLNAPQHFDIATPTSFPISNLIAADLRGTGHADLVGSNGVVLLNNGTGTFAAGSSAFVPGYANSNYGPNLAAGDFNNDGKLDLAVNNGTNIQLRMGNGDGTFTTGKSYASINDVGYVTATDLDGDGGTDLFVGLANGGAFGGDQFAANQAYALMGNGDGSFQGAASEPFVYTGTSGADLDGDGNWDYVGVDDTGFTTYLGDGSGDFAAHATVAISPVTINGHSVTVTGDVDSYAVGDINGDGHDDFAYVIKGFTVQNPTTLVFTPGVFIALGDGHGGLGVPSFYPVATTLASPDFETAWVISNLRLADFNGDHKADLSYNYVATSYTANNDYFGTVVQLGNGDKTFQDPQVIPYYSRTSTGSTIGRSSTVQKIADLNKDGIPDLIFLSQSATIDSNLSTYVATIQVALGVGDGTFAAKADVTGPAIMVAPFQNGSTATIAVSDMDGDGTPDIVALGASAIHDVQLAIALGNGNGTFKAPTITNYGAQYLNTEQGIATGDFNGDGKLDVLISDPFISTNSGVSLGNGDGSVQTIAGGSGALPSQSIALSISGSGESMDFNGDGKADALVGSTLLLGQGAASGTQSSSTTLTAAPNPADVGQSVTLTAQVAGSGGGTPTGSVSFLDRSTIIGSDTVSAQGSATFTTSTLVAGTHSLKAQYSGDSNFFASTSTAVTLSVGAATLDFTIGANPDSGSVAAGASATSTITLTPSDSTSGTVTLACAGLPSGATCSFTPPSVALSGAAATSTVTISTAAKMAMLSPLGRGRDPMLPTGLVLAGVFATGIVRRNHRRRLRASRAFSWMSLFLVCAGAMALASCGGGGGDSGGSTSGGGTPSGTYTITITGTSGSTSHAVAYTLTVN